jgi:hypothetical protein
MAPTRRPDGVSSPRWSTTVALGSSVSAVVMILVEHWFEELKRLVPTK